MQGPNITNPYIFPATLGNSVWYNRNQEALHTHGQANNETCGVKKCQWVGYTPLQSVQHGRLENQRSFANGEEGNSPPPMSIANPCVFFFIIKFLVTWTCSVQLFSVCMHIVARHHLHPRHHWGHLPSSPIWNNQWLSAPSALQSHPILP